MVKLIVPNHEAKCNLLSFYLKKWSELGLINIEFYDGDFVWVHKIGDTLFWPWPTVVHKVGDIEYNSLDIEFRKAIFTNTVPLEVSTERSKDIFPSFFWGRAPYSLEEASAIYLPYEERACRSMFVGRVETDVQHRYRCDNDYSSVIEVYFCGEKNTPYPYKQKEYLDKLSNSKFSLSLRGYGPKCNREIESLALGSVLLVNEDVDTKNYLNPLVEGVHYLKYDSLDSLKELQYIPKEQWEYISKNGCQWYQDNCSIMGAFNVFKRVLELSL